MGTISVDNLLSGRPVSAATAGPLLALCNHVATAVERARLRERELAEHGRLEVMATTDTLTHLPNRVLLQRRLDQGLADAALAGKPLALLVMDLDRFKEINDTLGHHCGDQLLQQIGPRITSLLRDSDTVARLGGDEFAVILPSAGVADALRLAWTIRNALEEPFLVEQHALDVGISIGVAAYPDHGAHSATLLRCADVAMYAAKRARSGVAVYAQGEDGHSVTRLTMASDLRIAIAAGQLVLHYQPLRLTRDGRFTRVEALVRWLHPVHGLMPPDSFIPLAEHTGLIVPLTEWVLRTALRQCRAWSLRGQELGVQVNLSMHNLHDRTLPDLIQALLQETGVAPALLTLEITESALMTDPARALEVLARLAGIGVRLSIDDFGTGYSSLAYLKRLPVDEVKIDRSFVRDLNVACDPGSIRDNAIVRTVIAMAHALGLEVVAEGVESREACSLLEAMQCDTTQGYYHTKPLPVTELDRWLNEWAQGAHALENTARHASPRASCETGPNLTSHRSGAWRRARRSHGTRGRRLLCRE